MNDLRWKTSRGGAIAVIAGDADSDLRIAIERKLLSRGTVVADTVASSEFMVLTGDPHEVTVRAMAYVSQQLSVPFAVVNSAEAASSGDYLSAAVGADAFPPTSTGDDIAMADRGSDRDGLKLDQLHFSLGPILPHWPGGLTVDIAMQGDVIQTAEPKWAPHALRSDEATPPLDAVARRLDDAYVFLSTVGWRSAASEARRLRDTEGPAHRKEVGRFTKSVARSRSFHWMTKGIATHHGLDARDRLLAWLVGAQADCSGGQVIEHGTDHEELADLAALLVGLDLRAARLAIASFGTQFEGVLVGTTPVAK